MKPIISYLNKEVNRARRVIETFDRSTPQHQINAQISDQLDVHVFAVTGLDIALDDFCRDLLQSSAWKALSPRQRQLVRAYRKAGGLPDIADPEGYLV